ncbi:hypothetical protein M073_1416 [Bacteroides fragilis str. DS-71]|jgi:hypothetical protein|nr:hypothetical protein M073_1416 [Bacteroides fragilis str. DS-71]
MKFNFKDKALSHLTILRKGTIDLYLSILQDLYGAFQVGKVPIKVRFILGVLALLVSFLITLLKHAIN